MLAVSMSPPVMHFPRVQKRPKLSLQTSELHVSYGGASKNMPSILAAPNTNAITPTTFNTFTNTFELTHRPSPVSATSSPSTLRSDLTRDRPSRPQSPLVKRQSDRAYTVSLPYGTKPILKNGPFSKIKTASISASPRSSTRKVFFPVPKKVGFRNPVEEEIVTKVYTARHSDLFECEEQTKEAPADEDAIDPQEDTVTISKPARLSVTQTQHLSSVETRDLPRTVDCELTASPIISRKRRRWEWTLAPVQSGQPSSDDNARAGLDAQILTATSPSRPTLDLETRSYGSSPTMQKRAGSPEASPQKRKAGCLESVAGKDSTERTRASTF